MIALIDYGMGNLLSVSKALEKVGGKVKTTSSPSEVLNASAVVLPGVGNFGDGMKNLLSCGLAEAVREAISSRKPFLGICLGMHLLMDESEEAAGVKGLGIFRGKVLRFPGKGLKVPHMGWNQVNIRAESANFAGIPDRTYFYFVHSYYVKPEDSEIIIGACSYGVEFASCIGNGKIFAAQFHPEKSQDAGLRMLGNWVAGIKRK